MSVTKSFYNTVNEGNLTRVHVMMIDSLLLDLSFDDYEQMENIALKKFDNLYEVHDGKNFINDKSKWGEEYISKLQVELMNNFSKSRVDHLKEVIRYTTPYEHNDKKKIINKVKNKNYSSDYKRQKQKDEEEGKITRLHKCAFASVGGSFIGGLGSYSIGLPVAGGIVVGAVAGGAVAYAITRGEEL